MLRSAQYYTLVGSHEDTQDFEFFKRNIHPDDVARVMQCIEAHLRGESTLLAFEYRLPTAPGQPAKWLRASGRVIERDAYGNPARMLGTLADISPRKAAEALAAQLQEQLLQLQQTGRGALQGKPP